MVNAVVLLAVERKKIKEVAETLSEIQGISEVYSVAGQYDLVAIIRAKSDEQLAPIVTERILQIDGITKTETLISFRVYSKHDLEKLFSVGME